MANRCFATSEVGSEQKVLVSYFYERYLLVYDL